jgi:ABC-type dipeptide/oligopeptide/nickel transport system ATPase component
MHPSREKFNTGHPITHYINHAIFKRNSNFMLLVTGAPGSGKSFSCLAIAQKLDPEFSVDRIVKDANQFCDMISNPAKYGLRKGSVIVFEEVGVNMNARDFQSVKNKMMSFITQTFRYQNLIVLFNSPHGAFVDINLRRLIHANLDVSHHDNKYGYAQFSFNVPDHLTGQVHQRPMMMRDLDTGQTVTLRRVKIQSPTKDLAHAYEIMASQFKGEIADNARAKVKGALDKFAVEDKMRRVLNGEDGLMAELSRSQKTVDKTVDIDAIVPSELGRVLPEGR